MTSAVAWLEPHIAGAPEPLRERMIAAVSSGDNVAQALAEAALSCLRHALDHPDDALDLLAADALLTHACAAAAEDGDDALLRFTRQLDAEYFQQLIEQRA